MSQKYKQKLSRNINLNYLSIFFESFLFFVPIWVAYERQYLTFTQMSVISISRQLITSITELPTGALADLIGRKWSVFLGYVSEAFGLLLVATATSGTNIFVGAIFRGLGDSLRSGAQNALIYDSLKELDQENKFVNINANQNFLSQVGLIISSIFAGYLFKISPSLPYILIVVLMSISAGFQMFIQEPKLDSEKFTISNYILQTKIGFKETFKDAYNKKLSIFYILVGGISWSTQIFLNQIYATSIGYGEIAKGWLFAIIRLVNSIIIIRLLKLTKIVDKKNAFLVFPILMIIFLIPAGYSSIYLGTILLFGITIISTLRFIVLNQLTNEVFVSKYRATAISTLNLFVSLVYIVIVSIAGIVIDKYGVEVYYTFLGILAFLVVLPLGIELRNISLNKNQP